MVLVESWLDEGGWQKIKGRLPRGEGGMITGGEEEEGERRNSKDKTINKEGRPLIDFIEEKGWSLFNGNIKGGEDREYTFTGGKGCTVIDYVMGDSDVRERVVEMRVRDKIESDHQPIDHDKRSRVR
ncbi:hypothetical protein X777_11276 [Ooceraea biroi]|uniref:Endonuclease/exonuclease/phosphatase domain-containing protein n=1 Tax=Ooceraea biroi TaxID=2015173 RepID=A0A026W2M6_OOCBI|nr:hypothetical protein X777_11276 [Ooceraea biroi]